LNGSSVHFPNSRVLSMAEALDSGMEAVKKAVVAALIVRDSRLLICQRTRTQPMALKWEFPGGKVEPGEQPAAALKRELEEELGIDAEIGAEVARIEHHYKNGGIVDLRFYQVRRYSGEMRNIIFKQIRWVNPRSLSRYDFLAADKDIIRKLAAGDLLGA
jgi:8-oxo-dGTP diphosphatase